MKREDIEQLATLARITLSTAEAESLADDITGILGYVSEINEISAGEEVKKVGVVFNVFREDEPSHEDGAYTEAMLAAAPERDGQYVKVKKILGDQ
jgi:aspartyl-tRNA(Asn)/glutamyl-tRNA(Gln) amidotransferase subunit C